MKKIDFTVLVPVYNTKPAELIECIYSLHHSNQTIDQEYDIVIVDDASNDKETCDALEFLKIALGIKVISMTKNGGTSAALNKGHEFITTEWIAISGSSDINFKNRFELQTKHLLEHPGIDVLGTQLYSFNDKDPYRKPTFTSGHAYTRTLEDSDYGWLTNHGTVMYKNQSVKDVGGYDLGYRRGQDTDLWKRMYNAGKKIHTLNHITYGWRRDK